ncbi:MAG: RNA methyltransferase [Chloroflexota bacterium]|nr:RNA methyltransferase [Chloroflexota bacterium]
MAPAPLIRSARNPAVAHVRSLQRGSARRRASHTVVEGPKLVAEALRAGVVVSVLCVDNPSPAAAAVADEAAAQGHSVRHCTDRVFNAVADTETPQGVLAVIATPDPPPLPDSALLLVLDAVQDPGNVGAMVRSAAAAGVTGVICTPGTADAHSPKAMRAGAGGQFRVPIRKLSESEDLEAFAAGVDLYAASADADLAYHDVDWTGPSGLIVGAESAGVSPAWRSASRAAVRVPMQREVESLNAAAAAAVILFEAARQRAAGYTNKDPGAGAH